jgi:hypothetical protein
VGGDGSDGDERKDGLVKDYDLRDGKQGLQRTGDQP